MELYYCLCETSSGMEQFKYKYSNPPEDYTTNRFCNIGMYVSVCFFLILTTPSDLRLRHKSSVDTRPRVCVDCPFFRTTKKKI